MPYNLEEFKRWLADDPTRQENLPDWKRELEELATKDFHHYITSVILMYWQDEKLTPYQQITKKWAEQWKEQIEYTPNSQLGWINDVHLTLEEKIAAQKRIIALNNWQNTVAKDKKNFQERERERERERESNSSLPLRQRALSEWQRLKTKIYRII